MKKNSILTILVFSIIFGITSQTYSTETNNIPTPLKKALENYKKEGVDQFMPILLKDSPIEGDKAALSQSNVIRQVETFYGQYLDYEVIDSVEITKTTRLVYFVMKYEKGPLFGVVTAYKTKEGEIITHFNFHTEIQRIMPAEYIFSDKN